MDTLSSDIRILIKKASEWPQPHNLDHIKPADGKPCGFSTNQHMPPITDLFPFSEFISKYMNGPFKFHDEPAKKPFLSKLPPFHFQGALEVSKIVILLTTENSLNPTEQRLLSDYISSRSISCQELRDETILQILSQTSGRTFGSPPTPVPPPPPPPPGHLPFANARAEVLANVNNAADHKSWVLLADCLSCVKPSFNFQNYILSYLTSASGDGYEVLCFNKLHQNCSSGEECLRYYPPCLLEKFANQNHCFMALSCSFSDESIGSGQVSSWTLAKEFASSILRDMKNIPANHALGWTVALRDPQGLYECQSDDFVMDLISELEVPASFCSQPANFLVTKFSKTSSGRYIHGEHPHNIQRKRLLLVKPNKHSSIVPRSPYVRRDNSKNKQNIPSKRQPDYESLNASLRSSTIPVMDATHWIDDVFQGALNHESILDSEVIATRIKGGVDDQLNSGMPIMMPQFVPHPYMTQPMMPMILPNPQMMFNPATNPALYQQATSHVDHLFFHVDPQRRKEANDLKVQLETKELEKKVLEMTLQTEVLKQRIQDFQSFPSQQKGQPNRQQTTLPQYSQSFAPPPLKPQIIQDTAKKPLVKSEHIAFESPPILHPPVIVPKQLIDKGNSNLVLQTEDKGDSQNSSETSDSVRKVRKLGKFVWPPEDQEKSKQKPMIKPGKLLIDETKADTVEVIKIPKVPPKPPPKTKPLKLARTDNNLKTKPVDQDVSQKPAATNSDADNFTLSLVKMKLEEIFAKGSASEESTTAELTDFAQQKPPSRGQSLSPFPEISRSTMTYAGVDWVLEIRKELYKLGTRQSLHKLGLTSVSLADTSIQLTGHIKLLGVTLDSNLSLDKHVSTVARSCNYQLWSLRHIRHLLTVDVTAALCRCLILSRLDYCNSLLHQLSSASLQKLQRIQHKAARLVIGGDVEPTDAMTSLHWLPVPERIKFKVALLAHKALMTGMPSYIASTLSPHSHVRSLRSESSNFLNIPIPRNKFEAKSFKFSAPRTWNGLPPQLRASDSFSLFKANLKTHLFPQQRRTKRP